MVMQSSEADDTFLKNGERKDIYQTENRYKNKKNTIYEKNNE